MWLMKRTKLGVVVIILYSAACGYDIHLPINPFRSNEKHKVKNKVKLRTPSTTLFPFTKLGVTALAIPSKVDIRS
jgi:hypothetical protein